jgi:hypothetical protein
MGSSPDSENSEASLAALPIGFPKKIFTLSSKLRVRLLEGSSKGILVGVH